MRAHRAAEQLDRIVDEVDERRPRPKRLVELVAQVAEARAALTAPGAKPSPDALHILRSLEYLFGQWAPPAPSNVVLLRPRRMGGAR
jgi:hypothetical protein